MSEKSKRDLQYEKKKKEREERLRRQREGDAGKEFPQEQQQFPPNNFNEIPPPQNNGFRQAKKADNWEANEGFQQQNNVNQSFAPQTQIKQDRNFVEPTRNQQQNFGQDQMVQNSFHANQQQQQQVQQEEGNIRNNKKQFIQAQVVNQAIEVQNANMQMNNQQNEGHIEKQAINDQKIQKQQYNNILQQQMAEKQIQQERERQQKEMERQKMEDERKKIEMQKEQERERKEQYRLQLQEQMKMKEQQSQQFQNQQQQMAPPVHQQQYNNQIQAQQFYGGMQFDNQANNANQKQEYRQFLMNQMQNKNQNNNQLVDKKALLQQQMEIQNQQSSQNQGMGSMPVNRTNFARKNINNMYNQPSMPSMSQMQNQEGISQNQYDQGNQFQQQRQPIQPINYHHQQQQIASTPQLNQGFQDGFQNNSQQYNQQAQNISQPISTKQEGFQQNQSGLKQNNGEQVSAVRGNRNFMKIENADLGEINRKQQQMLEYKRELEKQRQEQAMKKKQEEERIKKEELEEEKKILKEQEELKRRIEEENNSKKQQQENIQKENEQLREQKLKNKRQNNDGFAAVGSSSKLKSEENNTQLPFNLVSKQFLNDEKISEGIDPRASLMEFHRKKSAQNLVGQGSMVQTPQNNVMTPMNQQQQNQQNMFANNMMQQPNPFMQQQMQQNPMMYGNQFMMGQFPPMPFAPQMAPMMMNPQLMQQQQFLAKQQADILPQLYELKLQMQQQQHQIDLIKSQANVAIDERNKAEQKYLELKKLYESKQQEEKKYQQQLQDALSRYHPSNKPHQQLKKELDFITPTQGEQFEAPMKYQFHENQAEAVKPFNNEIQNNKQKNQGFSSNRIDQGNQGVAFQPQINIIKYQDPPSYNQNINNNNNNNNNQNIKQLDTLNTIPTNNNRELDSNPKQYEDNLLAEKAKKEYELKMHQYGMKSLVSNNKFIPLDILDQVKDSQITMSKLGNYGVNGSQVNVQQNHGSAQNLNLNNNNSGFPRRPQSYNRSSNDLGNKDNHLKYDIPSINSDIMKDIDKIMQKNNNNVGDQFATQQSFYHQNPRQIKDTNKINNENQNEGNSYNPQIGFNQNVYAQKPPSRLGSNQGMRRTGKEQNNPFGSAARGILGDSKAFEQQKQQKQIQQSNTFKTNIDQEGYNLGSDFPDFSINNKKGFSNGFGSKPKIEQNHSEANFQASELNFRASGMLKNDNNNITYNNNNVNTYNTNNFDIDKINQRNEERLKKLNQFNINTVNNETQNHTISNNNDQNQDVQDKLEQLLQRFNKINNVE